MYNMLDYIFTSIDSPDFVYCYLKNEIKRSIICTCLYFYIKLQINLTLVLHDERSVYCSLPYSIIM